MAWCVVKRGTVQSGSAPAAAISPRAGAHGSVPAVDVRATATLTPGLKTQRVASVKTKRSKAIKSSARRILAGRTATITVCISLDVADLDAIDADAAAAGYGRSCYLVECWRKARGL